MGISEIQRQIGSGQYQVSPRAVADAILRRLLGLPHSALTAHPSPAAPARQEECS